jgi:hypothetical protein
MNQSLLGSKQTTAGTAATYPYRYRYSKYTVLEIEAIHKNVYASKFYFQPGAPVGYPQSVFQQKFLLFTTVLLIRIWSMVCFLGLLDLDPLVGGTVRIRFLSSSKKSKKNLDSYCFVT